MSAASGGSPATRTASELAISPDAAFFIVEKARELAAKVEQTNPNDASNPADDRGVDILEQMRDDATYEELKSAVEALNEDERADLVALLWLGRGDFSLAEWDEARRLARARQTTPAAEYIVGDPLASDEIEQGLALFGCEIGTSKTGRRF